MMGFEFHVLPDVFVVHWNHPPGKWSSPDAIPEARRRSRTFFGTLAELQKQLETGKGVPMPQKIDISEEFSAPFKGKNATRTVTT